MHTPGLASRNGCNKLGGLRLGDQGESHLFTSFGKKISPRWRRYALRFKVYNIEIVSSIV
jgi:hypothetical protein